MSTSTLFTDLDKVKEGDQITVEVFGEVLAYKVTETRVVELDDTEAIRPITGKDLLTLVTCTPIGINSQRILVTGERMHPTPEKDIDDAGKAPDIPGTPWWAVTLGGSVVALGGYIYVSGRPAKTSTAKTRTAK